MDLKELKALLRLMEGNEVEEGGRRVRIRRRPLPASMHPASPSTALGAAHPSALPSPAAAAEAAGLIPVESPMVGTFYRAPAPGAEPYVKEGVTVQKGTVICIIEAMKLMNEIEAEFKGRVVRLLVDNAQPVEFGQKLFLIEPV